MFRIIYYEPKTQLRLEKELPNMNAVTAFIQNKGIVEYHIFNF